MCPASCVVSSIRGTGQAVLACLCRMRISMTGARGQLEMTAEVMSILPGVHLVDIAKVTGDSVDFYNAYSQITDLVQPLITADALRRADSSGESIQPLHHRALLLMGAAQSCDAHKEAFSAICGVLCL